MDKSWSVRQVWEWYGLPMTPFSVTSLLMEKVDNMCGVNGVPLPIDPAYSGLKYFAFSDSNRDWVPFFPTLMTARTIFETIDESVDASDDESMIGLLFDPNSYNIYLYTSCCPIDAYLSDYRGTYHHSYHLGNFDMNYKQIQSAIEKFQDYALYLPSSEDPQGYEGLWMQGMSHQEFDQAIIEEFDFRLNKDFPIHDMKEVSEPSTNLWSEMGSPDAFPGSGRAQFPHILALYRQMYGYTPTTPKFLSL